MNKNFLVVGVLILIIVGLFMYNQQKPEVKPDNSNSITENASKSEPESNTPQSSPINANTPVISNSKTLDLSNQELRKVPNETFNQTAVQELNLANNSLEGSLPGEIRFLKNLKVLNLSNNNFTGVPAEIGQLSNLEVLDLSNNNLTGLPNELANLKNLKLLKLSGNNYSASDLEIIKKGLPNSVVIEIQ